MNSDDDFAAYVAGRWNALVRAALFLGCGHSEAEDVVQSTPVRCYRHWNRVAKADEVDAYVYRILVNTFRKSRGRRWHSEEVATSEVPDRLGPDVAAASDARADVERALAGLSFDHRTVLVLRYLSDLTEQQVATVLGISVGTVKSRASRAFAAIDRSALREETR